MGQHFGTSVRQVSLSEPVLSEAHCKAASGFWGKLDQNDQISKFSCFGVCFFILFSSLEPLGSQGELIVCPASIVCPPFSKISSDTAGPIKAKFHVKPPW